MTRARKPAFAVLALSAAFAGCGGGASSDAPIGAKPTGGPESTPGQDKAAKARSGDDPVTVKGKMGDSLTLVGSGLNDDPSDHSKTKIKVRLQAVRGPFKGFQIPSNRALIGVELEFTNVGAKRYDDPLPDGTLTVAGGESGKQTNLIPLSGANPCDNRSLKLKAGQSKSTCIAFEIPKREKPLALEYVSDSGYGDTGLWSLR
jgi:hypothetical protein